MSQNMIEKIEKKLNDSSSLNEATREELLRMLATLKEEVGELASTHGEEAESIAGFAGTSAHEAMRTKTDPQLLELSLKGLSSSAKEFEISHPKLVEIVNSMCTMLSDLGI